MVAIEVTGRRRTYGSGDVAFEAVRGIDLAVAAGTVHALLGVNGAGKTSALDVIEGLSPASGGDVRVLGLDPVADRGEVRRCTGVLLQRSGFVGDPTVRETLQMWAAGVTDARPVTGRPEVVMLDEPTTGLDPESRRAAIAGFFVFTVQTSLWVLRVAHELDGARQAQADLAVAEERLRFSRDVITNVRPDSPHDDVRAEDHPRSRG